MRQTGSNYRVLGSSGALFGQGSRTWENDIQGSLPGIICPGPARTQASPPQPTTQVPHGTWGGTAGMARRSQARRQVPVRVSGRPSEYKYHTPTHQHRRWNENPLSRSNGVIVHRGHRNTSLRFAWNTALNFGLGSHSRGLAGEGGPGPHRDPSPPQPTPEAPHGTWGGTAWMARRSQARQQVPGCVSGRPSE